MALITANQYPMKKTICALLLAFAAAFFVQTSPAVAQGANSLPEVTLKDLFGKNVKTSTFVEDGQPFVLSFWATWCKPCIKELRAVNEHYEEWREETGVRLIAVSIDDSRNASKVGPFVSGQGWEYEVYLDENSELKRKMNVANVPHTFLVDGSGKVVWQHNSYQPGDELELYEQMKKVGGAEE